MTDGARDPATIDHYAVMGNPIAHSKSPLIHRLFAEQTGQTLRYDALLVEPGGFNQAVAEFRAGGGKGLNVTVPFKQQARQLADQLSARARRAGAVNTLCMRDQGVLFGDNTDGVGLVRDLTANLGLTVAGKRLLVIGAGGAARGVLAPLLEQGPSAVHLANRTRAKATTLAETFVELGDIQASGLDAIPLQHYDLIINATAAGLDDDVPALPAGIIDTQSYCYDMMYASKPTAFVRFANRQDCAGASDGLGMLVEQAAEAFYLWRGVRPDTAPVMARLRDA